MSFFYILYDIIILPIEAIIEFVFCFTLDKFSKFGIGGAIVAVSLAVNFLALPIYNVADEIQIKERELQKKMAKGIARIKQAFYGDERFMMLNTYYRQNNYHPLYALRQSLSVLIEVPFFIAAYHFLSHCSLLENQSILFLSDLSKPDALISVMGGGVDGLGFSINILPILMTAINVVSSIIYTKGAPIWEKMQTFALAGIFLVLLYNSPSGLVFYWVLNQIFSLCKNILKKMKCPGMVVYWFLSAILLFVCAYFILVKANKFSVTKCCFYLLTILFISAPFAWRFLKSKKFFEKIDVSNSIVSDKQSFALFFTSCVSLCLLCGLLLPSSTIATSPAEFSFLGSTESPLSYVWSSLAFFAGAFVFWPLVIYKMFSENKMVKAIIPPLFFVLLMCVLANVFLFKYDYGTISVYFKLDDFNRISDYSAFFTIFPVLFFVFVSIIYFLFHRFKIARILPFFVLVSVLAEVFVGGVKVKNIKKDFSEIARMNSENIENALETTLDDLPIEFHLSKTEKNVIILFLDRAVSAYFPYVLEQFPDMKNSFEGIVYYPNCVSYGGNTINAASPLIGGYDYIPQEIKKDNRLLVEKHNEALLVLPQNFHEADYSVKVADLPFANYKWGMDFSFYNQYGYINAKELENNYGKKYVYEYKENLIAEDASVFTRKNIKSFSILQIIYPPLRKFVYGDGQYYSSSKYFDGLSFIYPYAELYYLPKITGFDSQQPSFIFFLNDTCHNLLELAAPDYRPALIGKGDFSLGTGCYDYLNKDYDYLSYQPNAAALIQIAKWFDYLKENDVYDNTRIIIVADHSSRDTNRKFVNFKTYKDVLNFNPLFLFKDFDSHGEPSTDNTFISNAETPYFATKDLDVSNINPFTKNKFRQASDFDLLEIVKVSEDDINPQNWLDKTEFKNKRTEHYTVHDNIFVESNWRKLDASEK